MAICILCLLTHLCCPFPALRRLSSLIRATSRRCRNNSQAVPTTLLLSTAIMATPHGTAKGHCTMLSVVLSVRSSVLLRCIACLTMAMKSIGNTSDRREIAGSFRSAIEAYRLDLLASTDWPVKSTLEAPLQPSRGIGCCVDSANLIPNASNMVGSVFTEA